MPNFDDLVIEGAAPPETEEAPAEEPQEAPEDAEEAEEEEAEEEAEGEEGEAPEGEEEASEEAEGEPADEGEEAAAEEEEASPPTITLKTTAGEIDKPLDEVVSLAQKGLDAHIKYREAVELKEQSEFLRDEAKTFYDATTEDPLDVARQLWMAKGASEEWVDKEILRYLQENVSYYSTLLHGKAEEQEQIRTERRLEVLRREKDQLEAENAKSNSVKTRERVETGITEGLTAVGLAADGDTKTAVANKLVNAAAAGESLTIEDAVRIVKIEQAEKLTSLPELDGSEFRDKHPDQYNRCVEHYKKTLRDGSTKPGAMRPGGAKRRAPTKPKRRAPKRQTRPFDELIPQE